MQPVDVTFEEPLEVFAGGRNGVQLEELAHQADIGPPGELHVLNAVARTELGVEHPGKCLDARAARVD